MQPPRAWILSLFLGVLYANVKDARHNWINSISHWIAERSYGIYLSHSIILWIVFYRMDQFPLGMQIPTLIAGSIGIPAVLYITIERPLIRLGARLAKRILMRPSKNSISQPA
jgi:peptidoglycan/LPS O-acetylase OafA/YrhL